MKLRNVIREYFTFTRNERIGLYALIAIIILLGIANQVIFLFEKPGIADQEEFNQLLKAFNKNQSCENVIVKSLFIFNPNTIDSLALDSLALPNSIKMNMLRYRAKGGRFRFKEDLKKLYGMNDSIFEAIDNFIQLKSKAYSSKRKKIVKKFSIPIKIQQKSIQEEEKQINQIEINSATESELKSIYGIGNVFSSRIIKYRNLLGGYYEIDQLKEVYGLSEETFCQISPFLIVDTTFINCININFASKKQLVRHPYLSWKEVNAIFSFKSKVGFIELTSQLKEENILNDSIYQQVCPYLRTKNN